MPNPKIPYIEVTCAIIERSTRVLAVQRSANMPLPYKWEFPGGKINPGESPEECIRREIREELGIIIHLKQRLPVSVHQYPSLAVALHPYICSIESGEIVLHEHAAVTWLAPRQLHNLNWAEADVPVLSSYLSVIGESF